MPDKSQPLSGGYHWIPLRCFKVVMKRMFVAILALDLVCLILFRMSTWTQQARRHLCTIYAPLRCCVGQLWQILPCQTRLWPHACLWSDFWILLAVHRLSLRLGLRGWSTCGSRWEVRSSGIGSKVRLFGCWSHILSVLRVTILSFWWFVWRYFQ